MLVYSQRGRISTTVSAPVSALTIWWNSKLPSQLPNNMLKNPSKSASKLIDVKCSVLDIECGIAPP